MIGSVFFTTNTPLALFEGNNGHNNNLIMRTLLTALLLPGAKGFYLPGVNPYSFFEGEA